MAAIIQHIKFTYARGILDFSINWYFRSHGVGTCSDGRMGCACPGLRLLAEVGGNTTLLLCFDGRTVRQVLMPVF